MSKAQIESDRYHREYYDTHQLFEPGSWLEKPNSALMEIGARLANKQEITLLDLGAGVGRNAIPLAQLFTSTAATIDCVDVVELAIEKLKENSVRYQVAHIVNPIVAHVAEFHISPSKYDLVMAMSVLEHAVQADQLEAVIRRIQNGTKISGFNCLSIATDLSEVDCETGEGIAPVITNAISSEQCEAMLRNLYKDWETQSLGFSTFRQRFIREGRSVDWSADYCLLVAKRLL